LAKQGFGGQRAQRQGRMKGRSSFARATEDRGGGEEVRG